MHSYLRAIGFGDSLSRKDMDNLLGEVMTTSDLRREKYYNNNERFVEISKEICNDMGITIRGYYDNKSFFHLESYYPFLFNEEISLKEEECFYKKTNITSYNCICNNKKLGIQLNFYLQNIVDYMFLHDVTKNNTTRYSVALSGLCNKGKILLPLNLNEDNNTLVVKYNNEDCSYNY